VPQGCGQIRLVAVEDGRSGMGHSGPRRRSRGWADAADVGLSDCTGAIFSLSRPRRW